MRVAVPRIRIAGRPVGLAHGDAFAAEDRQRRVRQATRGMEDAAVQVVRHVQRVSQTRCRVSLCSS